MHAAIAREEELFNEGDGLHVGGHGAGRQLSSLHGFPHLPSLSNPNLSYGYAFVFAPAPVVLNGIKFFTHGEGKLGGHRQFPGRPRLHRRPQIRKSRILFKRRKKIE